MRAGARVKRIHHLCDVTYVLVLALGGEGPWATVLRRAVVFTYMHIDSKFEKIEQKYCTELSIVQASALSCGVKCGGV